MAYCPLCKTSGVNMFRCEKCGAGWCLHCLKSGKYPDKVYRADNLCPSCGANAVKPAG